MKKAFPVLALLVVLAGVIAFTWRRVGGVVGERYPASRAAELAPGEARVFLHLPDFERTSARWPQSALWPVAEALKAHMGNATTDLSLLVRLPREFAKAAPAGFFLAINDVAEKPLPKLVGGFPYRAKRTELESVARQEKDQVLRLWPGAKSELFSHGGIQIEVITGTPIPTPGARITPNMPPSTLFFAYRDDWFFFATDRTMLTDTLDRYLRKADAPKSLAENPVFVEARKHEVPEADVIVWQPWFSDDQHFLLRFSALSVLWNNPGNPLRAMHYTARIDGPSRIYLPMEKAPTAGGLVHSALALTTPAAQAYGAIALDALRGQEAWIQSAMLVSRHWAGLWEALGTPALPWREVWAAFGPGINFVFFAGKSSIGPDYVVALDVRDAEKARKIADTLAAGKPTLSVHTEGGVTGWNWPADASRAAGKGEAAVRFFPAPILLTKSHLVFGTSRDAVIDVARRSSHGGPTMQTTATAAARDLGPVNGATFYCDSEALFRDKALALPTTLLRQPPGEVGSYQLLQGPFGQSPGAIRIHSEGSGWMVESDLSIFGNHVVSWMLRGAP